MSNHANTLSHYISLLSKQIEETKSFISHSELYLISPDTSEVPHIERSSVLKSIEELSSISQAYVDRLDSTFEVIKFLMGWPK